jgi:hypothetical protein
MIFIRTKQTDKIRVTQHKDCLAKMSKSILTNYISYRRQKMNIEMISQIKICSQRYSLIWQAVQTTYAVYKYAHIRPIVETEYLYSLKREKACIQVENLGMRELPRKNNVSKDSYSNFYYMIPTCSITSTMKRKRGYKIQATKTLHLTGMISNSSISDILNLD